jgi:hypothetical protein
MKSLVVSRQSVRSEDLRKTLLSTEVALDGTIANGEELRFED